jgi:hypothetical protein
MNKPIKRNVPKKVIKPGEESAMMAAERLAAQGMKAFGDPNAKFDLNEDAKLQSELYKMDVQTRIKDPNEEIKGFGMDKQKRDMAPIYTMGNNENDLKEAVDKAKEKQDIENKEEKKEEQQLQLSDDPIERIGQVAEMCKKQDPNFPSKELILKWRQMHGELSFSDINGRLVLFRYLKRQEQIQMDSNEDIAKMLPHQKQDVIWNRCVLYPSDPPEVQAAYPAGLIPTLINSIERESLYLDPREVAAYTIKL